MKSLVQGKIGNNNIEIITSWPEYLLKEAKICKNINEAINLTTFLTEKGYISTNGELNNDKIIEKGEKAISNKKIRLNLGI